MTYETIKSAILTILVFLSIFLTWNLWTYQPNYQTMQKSKTIAEVTLSEKQEVKKIIRPDIAMFHEKGNNYGTMNSNNLDKFISDMSRWSFIDFKYYTNKAGNIDQLEQGNGKVEIIFPAEVPIELYRNVLNFQQKKLPSLTFDRIIINIENGVVYFVSTANQQVYASHVSATFLNDFYRNFYTNANQYPRYFAYHPSSGRTIYLPENATEMTEYKYLPVTLNSDNFRDALFTDPSFVQKTAVPNGEEYTNGLSMLNINDDNNQLLYVNPTSEGNYTENSYDLVKRSIDFVNDHGGWTDPYRYAGKDDAHHQVTFRLYSVEGYPVFNDDGISEINESWGPNDIYKYTRSNFSLDLPIKTEMQTVTRPSGYTILSYIQSRKNFKPELLEDVVLGYDMEKDLSESKLIVLEPAWYYQYDNMWYQVTMNQLGGNE